MRRRLSAATLFAACLAWLPAAAAGLVMGGGFSMDPAEAEEKGAAKVTISKQDCARLVRHQPSADVTYKPGVDARGRAVAPADLPGSGGAGLNLVPEVLEIPVSINPFTNLGVAPVQGLENTAMAVATVRYDVAKGQFTVNGQPLGSAEQQQIAEGCARRGVR